MSSSLDIKVAGNGRMVLPKSVRGALGLSGSGIVVATIDGDSVRLQSIAASIKEAQALFRASDAPPLTSESFLAERKRQAAKEH